MAITGITANGIMPLSQAAQNRNTGRAAESGFENSVIKCVRAGNQEVLLCSDALMSYASPQTRESVNIYRAENYSKENPVYILKGLDASGNPFEREVDAGRIDPNRCSFNELMVLNVETGHTSPDDYLHAVVTRDKAGADSYFDQMDYLSCAKGVMEDMKTIGSWDTYLSFGRWIDSILKYCSKAEGI